MSVITQFIQTKIRELHGIQNEFERAAAANDLIDYFESSPRSEAYLDALTSDQAIALSSMIGDDMESLQNRHVLYETANIDEFPTFEAWHDERLDSFKEKLEDDPVFQRHLEEGVPVDESAFQQDMQHYVDLYCEATGIDPPPSVVVVDQDSTTYGAYYEDQGQAFIEINMNSADPAFHLENLPQLLDTVAHEADHAMQARMGYIEDGLDFWEEHAREIDQLEEIVNRELGLEVEISTADLVNYSRGRMEDVPEDVVRAIEYGVETGYQIGGYTWEQNINGFTAETAFWDVNTADINYLEDVVNKDLGLEVAITTQDILNYGSGNYDAISGEVRQSLDYAVDSDLTVGGYDWDSAVQEVSAWAQYWQDNEQGIERLEQAAQQDLGLEVDVTPHDIMNYASGNLHVLADDVVLAIGHAVDSGIYYDRADYDMATNVEMSADFFDNQPGGMTDKILNDPAFRDLAELFHHNNTFTIHGSDAGYISGNEAWLLEKEGGALGDAYRMQPMEEQSFAVGSTIAKFVQQERYEHWRPDMPEAEATPPGHEEDASADIETGTRISVDVSGGQLLMVRDPGRAYDPQQDQIAAMLDNQLIGAQGMTAIAGRIEAMQEEGYEPTIYDIKALETFSAHAEGLYMQGRADPDLAIAAIDTRRVIDPDAQPATLAVRRDPEFQQAMEAHVQDHEAHADAQADIKHGGPGTDEQEMPRGDWTQTQPGGAEPSEVEQPPVEHWTQSEIGVDVPTPPVRPDLQEVEYLAPGDGAAAPGDGAAAPGAEETGRPGVEAASYRIQSGDALSVIVQDHYDNDPDNPMGWDEVKEYTELVAKENGVDDIHNIREGATINLPDSGRMNDLANGHEVNDAQWDAQWARQPQAGMGGPSPLELG